MRWLLLLFAPLAVPAAGADVYRCVTENGVVRYSDKPCADGETERLDIESRPTDKSAVKARVEQRKEQIAELDEARAAEREAKVALRDKAEKRKQECAAAHERLRKLQMARRVTTGEGEDRRYLESAEIEQRRKEAAQKVAEACGN